MSRNKSGVECTLPSSDLEAERAKGMTPSLTGLRS